MILCGPAMKPPIEAEDLKDVAAAAWKSLKAGWEEAKKTFDEEKK